MIRRNRLVLPAWKLWLMNQPFRVLRAGAHGCGPGAANVLRAAAHAMRDALLDADRLRWWLVRALNPRGRRRRG